MNERFCLFYTELRKCLRNVTAAARERCAVLYQVQTAVWGTETEWNPSLLPWLFVVIHPPYPSSHKQMVAWLACQVYTDKNVCVWHEYPSVHTCVYDRTWNSTWQKHGRVLCLLDNRPLSSTTKGVLCAFVSITDHVWERRRWVLTAFEKYCNTVKLLCC